MKILAFALSLVLLLSFTSFKLTELRELPQDAFQIDLVRSVLEGDLLKGSLFINGEYIGTTYENNVLKINPGTYTGSMRYSSSHGHVQGPFGIMSDEGDFLLEVNNVTWSDNRQRSGILFHGGTKPEHSKGCIMLGAISKDSQGNRYIPEGHALMKMRKLFYGTLDPNSCPNKSITITITSE